MSTADRQTLTRGVQLSVADFTYQHPDRSHPAICGLNLEVSAGERVLLAGASGSGKSTLLHAIAGVQHHEDAASGGSLVLDGRSPAQARGRAGLVQQDPESQVVLSRVADDVAFSCENLAVPPGEIGARVSQALEAVGLGALRGDHPTAQLSGGQKQRLALAGVLAMRPGLLLLDEPTAHLDPQGRMQVREAVIDACRDTGATLMVVEHQLQTWAEHVDTLLVLEPGGGLRHSVPAEAIHQDRQLRAEMIAAGLWVPEHDPVAELPAWAPAPLGHGEPLMSAGGLAVDRQSPKTARHRAAPGGPALSGVDIRLRRSSTIGITGPNGAGKSTLLLTLAGLLPPHAGSLTADAALKADPTGRLVDSAHLWRAADLSSRIGTVFQEPEHQFVRTTVAGELRLSAGASRRPGAVEPQFTDEEVTARVAELLTRLGLEGLGDANPFTLSGGEKRRLSVGTALAAGPQLLMLDEPTSGQDAHTFAALVGLLREHLAAGGAIVAITHDRAFLRALYAEEFAVSPARSAAPPRPEPAAPRAMGPLLPAVQDASWLGRRGPLGKLVALLLITTALIATIDPVSPAVVAAASFAVLPAAGIRLGAFLRRIWVFAAASVVAVWGAALAAEESGRVLMDLGLTTISTGSLDMGLALGARAFAIVLPSVLIFSTTDPTDLADALAQQLRLPARFVLGALAAMRLLGLMAQHWATLGHARRARGLRGRFLSQSFGLLVQAIRMATRLALTMESRGFGAGERTWARAASFSGRDAAVITGGAAIAAAATGLAIAAGTWELVWT